MLWSNWILHQMMLPIWELPFWQGEKKTGKERAKETIKWAFLLGKERQCTAV